MPGHELRWTSGGSAPPPQGGLGPCDGAVPSRGDPQELGIRRGARRRRGCARAARGVDRGRVNPPPRPLGRTVPAVCRDSRASRRPSLATSRRPGCDRGSEHRRVRQRRLTRGLRGDPRAHHRHVHRRERAALAPVPLGTGAGRDPARGVGGPRPDERQPPGGGRLARLDRACHHRLAARRPRPGPPAQRRAAPREPRAACPPSSGGGAQPDRPRAARRHRPQCERHDRAGIRGTAPARTVAGRGARSPRDRRGGGARGSRRDAAHGRGAARARRTAKICSRRPGWPRSIGWPSSSGPPASRCRCR